MSGEAQALRNYRDSIDGYYVLQPATDIAVAGPFDERRDAEVELDRREHPDNGPPGGLVIGEVFEGFRDP